TGAVSKTADRSRPATRRSHVESSAPWSRKEVVGPSRRNKFAAHFARRGRFPTRPFLPERAARLAGPGRSDRGAVVVLHSDAGVLMAAQRNTPSTPFAAGRRADV